jgi:hypothetical protein
MRRQVMRITVLVVVWVSWVGITLWVMYALKLHSLPEVL